MPSGNTSSLYSNSIDPMKSLCHENYQGCSRGIRAGRSSHVLCAQGWVGPPINGDPYECQGIWRNPRAFGSLGEPRVPRSVFNTDHGAYARSIHADGWRWNQI